MSEINDDPIQTAFDKSAEFYTVKTRCTNCDHTGVITKKKGSKVDTRVEVCPKCGCTCLIKVSST